MNPYWKSQIKRHVPAQLLNSALLSAPWLYRTKLVQYESNLAAGGGLEDLYGCFEETRALVGNIAECGSSRCGTSTIMANWVLEAGVTKKIFAFDSFEGFLPEEIAKEKAAGTNTSPDHAFKSTSIEYVQRKLRKLDVDDVVVPVQGFFQDTLAEVNEVWSLALVDCDLEDSLVYCAEVIWPNLVSGGIIVFDDYTADRHHGARVGVDSFVGSHLADVAEHGLLKRLYWVRKK